MNRSRLASFVFSPSGSVTDRQSSPVQAQDRAVFDAVKTSNSGVLRRYLRTGGDPNIRDGDGNTPLHWAVVTKARPMVQILLENKAQVNAVNRFGRTPLHGASRLGLTLIVEDLLQAGADPWLEDEQGKPPLTWARAGGYTLVVALLEKAMASKPRVEEAVALGKPTEWNQWRGPGRNGVVLSSVPLASAWPPSGPVKKWEAGGFPQGGSGSPVVAGGRIFLYIHDSHVTGLGYSPQRTYNPRDVIVCLDANSGKRLWQKEFPGVETWHEGSGTPCVVDDKVYVMAARTAYCLEAATGKQIWIFEPRASPDVLEDGQEISSSFIVCDGVAVVCAGLTFGLDARTGSLLWRAPHAGGYARVMTSAVPWRKSGQTYMVYAGSDGIFCVDLRIGALRWRTAGDRRGHPYASSPVIEQDTLVVCFGGELRGYKLSLRGPQLLWGVRFLDNYASPVLSQGLVYAVDKNAAFCLDAATGKRHWTCAVERQEYAAPILADGKLYALVEHGRRLLMLDAAVTSGTVLGQTTVRTDNIPTLWSSPALWEGKLVLRLPGRVVCYDLTTSGPAAPPSPIVTTSELEAFHIEGGQGEITTLPDGTRKITVKVAGSEPWSSHAFVRSSEIKDGESYSITFDAKGENLKSVLVLNQLDAPPYSGIGLEPVVLNVGPEYVSFSLRFVAKDATRNVVRPVCFQVGKGYGPGILYVKNIQVRRM